VGKAKTAAGNIFTIMDIESEINAMDKRTNGEKVRCDPATFKGEIEFQNVWFRYPTRKNDWVLKGLNLKILPNETVALVGESGCGKSTTVSLILRFYDVNEGRILIDGVDVRDYDIVSLR
jgi:ATPase subunit of ABC transporter with duplicated ATPase domains